MNDDLAKSLRAWRERLQPAAVGLPRRQAGRTRGLRREELATLAGVSLNYLIRLEQGKAQNPSHSVIAALARALRLSSVENAYLHRLAGHAEPVSGTASRQVVPGVQRILERFDDVPVLVYDAAWTVVAANDMARALLGADVVGQSSARRQFLGPPLIEHDAGTGFEIDIVADLHRQIALHPDDHAVQTIVRELQSESPRFAALWAERPIRDQTTAQKKFHHPAVGALTLDCDTLTVAGTDLRIVLLTANPGSADADALKLLALVELGRPSRPAH